MRAQEFLDGAATIFQQAGNARYRCAIQDRDAVTFEYLPDIV